MKLWYNFLERKIYMKKEIVLNLMIIISLFMITGCKNKENYITDNEKLYI